LGTISRPLSPSNALTETRRDPTSRYPYPSYISTCNPSVVPESHPYLLEYLRQHSHHQLPRSALHPDQIVNIVMRQDHARGYCYSCDLNLSMSCFPPQLIPLIVTGPYHGFHAPECEQLKGYRSLPEFVPRQRQHDREQPSRPVDRLFTRTPAQREPDAAKASHGVGLSGIFLLYSW